MLDTWRTARRERKQARRDTPREPFQQALHDTWVALKLVVAVVLVWNLISLVTYVAHDNGDTMSSRAATWARNHRMGSLVDWMETTLYSDPPSTKPAEALALTGSAGAAVGSTVPGSPDTSVAAPSASAESTSPGTSAASTVAEPASPPPVAPSALQNQVSPALDNEGQWSPIATAAGHDVMWATSIRPLPDAASVVASVAEIDQTYVRVGMFNGAEQPGGKWNRPNRVVKVLQPALIAGFNGGFRFEHIKGGYKNEGITVRPLRKGDATIGITNDGKMTIGEYGRDLTDDGSFTSLRQNLILIVDGGKSQVQKGLAQGVWWGADYGNKLYVPRSAACVRTDGRITYALVSPVNATQLAQALINIGCVKAIQLDIDGTWPVFFTFSHNADGSAVGHFLDTRMGGNPQRYLTGSSKEFFAFFDAGQVPSPSPLDK
ncbi:MAG: phosphodiester glycosidase family protein [Actinomycetota bacterium]